MAALETILQRLELQADQFHRELEQAQRGVVALDRTSSRAAVAMQTGFARTTTALGALTRAIPPLAAALSTSGIIDFTTRTIQSAAALGDAAQAAGIGAEALQRWALRRRAKRSERRQDRRSDLPAEPATGNQEFPPQRSGRVLCNRRSRRAAAAYGPADRASSGRLERRDRASTDRASRLPAASAKGRPAGALVNLGDRGLATDVPVGERRCPRSRPRTIPLRRQRCRACRRCIRGRCWRRFCSTTVKRGRWGVPARRGAADAAPATRRAAARKRGDGAPARPSVRERPGDLAEPSGAVRSGAALGSVQVPRSRRSSRWPSQIALNDRGPRGQGLKVQYISCPCAPSCSTSTCRPS